MLAHPQSVLRAQSLMYFFIFALSVGKPVFYFPLFFIFTLLNIDKFSNFNRYFVMKKYRAIFIGSIILFLLLIFSIGSNGMTLSSPYATLIILIFSLLSIGLLLQRQNFDVHVRILGIYIFGLFLDSIITSTYSFMMDPVAYGYGRVISPFATDEMNSPNVSNTLAISFGFFYYYAIRGDSIFVKITAAGIVLSSVVGAVFLGGRTFFIIATLTIMLYMVINFSLRKIFNNCIILGVLIFASIKLAAESDKFDSMAMFMLSRFNNGIESKRFELGAQGIDKFINNPLGGFGIDTNIEYTHWYHNIFLDTGRVAGWLPVLVLVFSMSLIFKPLLYRYKQPKFILLVWVFIMAVFLMLQDVIIEGNQKILIVFFIAMLGLFESKLLTPSPTTPRQSKKSKKSKKFYVARIG